MRGGILVKRTQIPTDTILSVHTQQSIEDMDNVYEAEAFAETIAYVASRLRGKSYRRTDPFYVDVLRGIKLIGGTEEDLLLEADAHICQDRVHF
jgi:hypothetical protein